MRSCCLAASSCRPSRRTRPPGGELGRVPTAAARTRTRATRASSRTVRARPAASTGGTGFQLVRLIPSGRSLLIGFALVGMATALYLVGRDTSLLAVHDIRVTGASARVERQVERALQPLLGTSLLRVGTTDVAERLVAIPDVETVTIDRSFPHGLQVSLTTARRVAVLRQGRAAYVVSERARILAAAPRDISPALPRIWVPTAVDLSVGATVGDPLTAAAVHAATAVFRTGIGGLRVRSVQAGDDRLTYTLRNGFEVRLGTLQQVPLKLAIARRILAQGGVERYVDVSVPERPVAGTNSQVVG